MLGADGEAVAFAKRELAVADDGDASDRHIVNETLREIQEATDAGALADLWQSAVRHFSLTLSLGEPEEIIALGLDDAREAVQRLLSDSTNDRD